jgi:myo-inositol 2-dehydrogenase/D-chiro-inositol 1-dehydrogenase
MGNIRLNVGVIGAGMIGRVHAEHLAFRIPETNLVTIADINNQAVQELAGKLHLSKAVKDYHEILADPEVDAVAICSSTNTHAQIICEAAQAGKHIF